MSLDKVKQQVLALLEEPLRREQCEIVDLVLSAYRHRHLLRLYVYSSRGTTIDECARLSGVVGELIDGTELFEGGYTLEVSSPGLDRPLTTLKDFSYRVGETVEIRFKDRKQKAVKAKIISTSALGVEVGDSTGTRTIDIADIEAAKILIL